MQVRFLPAFLNSSTAMATAKAMDHVKQVGGNSGFVEGDVVLSPVAASGRRSRYALCQSLFLAEQARSDRTLHGS